MENKTDEPLFIEVKKNAVASSWHGFLLLIIASILILTSVFMITLFYPNNTSLIENTSTGGGIVFITVFLLIVSGLLGKKHGENGDVHIEGGRIGILRMA